MKAGECDGESGGDQWFEHVFGWSVASWHGADERGGSRIHFLGEGYPSMMTGSAGVGN
jgi:hypothetical protein